MLQVPRACTYVGCIADDMFGCRLRECAESDGVRTAYMVIDSDVPTGTCAVLVTGTNRSLVANLAAANHFKPDHLRKPEVWSLVEQAEIYYIASFFLTVSVESIQMVAEHAATHNKIFTMNLAAPFLCQFFKTQMETVLPYWDIVFGNETEATAFGKAWGFAETDVAEIAKRLAQLPKRNTARERIVVFTQGAQPTIVVRQGTVSTVRAGVARCARCRAA